MHHSGAKQQETRKRGGEGAPTEGRGGGHTDDIVSHLLVPKVDQAFAGVARSRTSGDTTSKDLLGEMDVDVAAGRNPLRLEPNDEACRVTILAWYVRGPSDDPEAAREVRGLHCRERQRLESKTGRRSVKPARIHTAISESGSRKHAPFTVDAGAPKCLKTARRAELEPKGHAPSCRLGQSLP